MTTDEWLCLISFARAPPTCKEGKQAKKFKMKILFSAGIEPATLCFLDGHLDRLAIETVDNMFLKLLQYSEVTGNAGASPNTVQYNLSK